MVRRILCKPAQLLFDAVPLGTCHEIPAADYSGRTGGSIQTVYPQLLSGKGLPIQALECMPDHIHVLFDARPNMNLAEFVNAFKSASSRTMRKQFGEELAPYYWKPYFWSMSYFIGTVSERTTAAIREYIKNQKE